MYRILIIATLSAILISSSTLPVLALVKKPSPTQAECLKLYPDNHAAYLDCLAAKKAEARQAAEEEKFKQRNEIINSNPSPAGKRPGNNFDQAPDYP